MEPKKKKNRKLLDITKFLNTLHTLFWIAMSLCVILFYFNLCSANNLACCRVLLCCVHRRTQKKKKKVSMMFAKSIKVWMQPFHNINMWGDKIIWKFIKLLRIFILALLKGLSQNIVFVQHHKLRIFYFIFYFLIIW